MKPETASYLFRYTDSSGAVVRTTYMRCDSDAEAIAKSLSTMRDKYAALEIFEGDRVVQKVSEIEQTGA